MKELAYLAGLFDGEGAIYLARPNTKPCLFVALTNTNKSLCDCFQERWPGYISKQHPARGRPIYRWGLYGKKAQPFLLAIQPYSIDKKEKIKLALEYIDIIGIRGVSPTSLLAIQRQGLTKALVDAQLKYHPRLLVLRSL